ncbi:MAG TPA: hypothetical protein VI341_00450, partial [Actinomycetota bacterium]
IEPKQTGEKMCFELQVKRNASWKKAFFDCYRMGTRQRVRIYIYNIPSREQGRLRASYENHPSLRGDRTPWSRFRMVA